MLEEQKSVQWVLITSIIMFFVSAWFAPSLLYPGYYPPREWSVWETFWYYINRIDVLLFIATVTTGTLFASGFARSKLMYRITLSLFVASMGLFFLTFIKSLFTIP